LLLRLKNPRGRSIVTVSAGLEVLDTEARADADALVLWQVTARAEALLEALICGLPSQEPLHALLGYLRNVVLTRITEEDAELLHADRLAHQPHVHGRVDAERQDTDGHGPRDHQVGVNEVRRARQEHLQLRDDIEDLAEAADRGTTAISNAQLQSLSEAVERLVSHLEAHLPSELVTLTEVGTGAAVRSWRSVMGWYPLTESSFIDLSTVPSEDARHAVLSKLSTMRVGERLDVEGDGNLEPLGHWLQHSHPRQVSWSTRRDNRRMLLSLTVVTPPD
jgi:uncharacterized protein (DUF2249 family)